MHAGFASSSSSFFTISLMSLISLVGSGEGDTEYSTEMGEKDIGETVLENEGDLSETAEVGVLKIDGDREGDLDLFCGGP